MLALLISVAGNALFNARSFLVKLFENDDPPITKAVFEALREPAPLIHDSVSVTVHRAQEVSEKK